ncbi:MAG: gldD [Flavipsychrobacter sp.]|jgi:gliding motility-associated lipoprotein GldD|nr:gldD [Flavipsychrobacter sp.]
MYRIAISLVLIVFAVSCKPTVYPPKPPGYFKIDTPEKHAYRLFDKEGYPYTFEYPVYAEITPDSSFFEEKADNPYWININFPSLGGIINFTYKEINANQPLSYLVKRAYDLSFFHHDKAQYIDNMFFDNGQNVYVVTYKLGGDAASKYQFTATDSVKHFIRGALYFDVTPNADSLQPAYDFLERDVMHMMETLRWRKAS